MLLEHQQELLLEGHLPMMLSLASDVLYRLVQQGDADPKGAVFDLPPKAPVLREGVVYPLGGAAFDQVDCLGNGHGRRQGNEDVTMVEGPAHFEGVHPVLAGDAAQVREEPFAQGGLDKRPTLFGAESAMEIGADIGPGPLQPSLRDYGNSKLRITQR